MHHTLFSNEMKRNAQDIYTANTMGKNRDTHILSKGTSINTIMYTMNKKCWTVALQHYKLYSHLWESEWHTHTSYRKAWLYFCCEWITCIITWRIWTQHERMMKSVVHAPWSVYCIIKCQLSWTALKKASGLLCQSLLIISLTTCKLGPSRWKLQGSDLSDYTREI